MDLYYFSGTGNSVYLANQLKKRIPEINLQPIVSLLEFETVIPKSKIIGLCFPNHAGHLPIPMKIFIKKLRLTGDEYLFAICNSAFSKSFANEDINKIISQNGCRLSSYFNITMPDNHSFVIKDYAPLDKEALKKYEYRAQIKIDFIKDIILSKKSFIERDNKPAPFPVLINKLLVPVIFFLTEKFPSIILKGTIYADSKCIGCKICEKVCPANRIIVSEGKPFFDHKKTCFGCYGCLNFCPKESIQSASKWFNGRSYSTKNGRYPHPYANANDIARQKNNTEIF